MFAKRFYKSAFPNAGNSRDSYPNGLIGLGQASGNHFLGFRQMIGIGAFDQSDCSAQGRNISGQNTLNQFFCRRLFLSKFLDFLDGSRTDKFRLGNSGNFVQAACMLLFIGQNNSFYCIKVVKTKTVSKSGCLMKLFCELTNRID